MIRLRYPKSPGLDRARERMIRETEIALAIGLLYPERAVRIPTIEVGQGHFDPAYAQEFWAEILE